MEDLDEYHSTTLAALFAQKQVFIKDRFQSKNDIQRQAKKLSGELDLLLLAKRCTGEESGESVGEEIIIIQEKLAALARNSNARVNSADVIKTSTTLKKKLTKELSPQEKKVHESIIHTLRQAKKETSVLKQSLAKQLATLSPLTQKQLGKLDSAFVKIRKSAENQLAEINISQDQANAILNYIDDVLTVIAKAFNDVLLNFAEELDGYDESTSTNKLASVFVKIEKLCKLVSEFLPLDTHLAQERYCRPLWERSELRRLCYLVTDRYLREKEFNKSGAPLPESIIFMHTLQDYKNDNYEVHEAAEILLNALIIQGKSNQYDITGNTEPEIKLCFAVIQILKSPLAQVAMSKTKEKELCDHIISFFKSFRTIKLKDYEFPNRNPKAQKKLEDLLLQPVPEDGTQLERLIKDIYDPFCKLDEMLKKEDAIRTKIRTGLLTPLRSYTLLRGNLLPILGDYRGKKAGSTIHQKKMAVNNLISAIKDICCSDDEILRHAHALRRILTQRLNRRSLRGNLLNENPDYILLTKLNAVLFPQKPALSRGSRKLTRSSSYFELSDQLVSPRDEIINLELDSLYSWPSFEWGYSEEDSSKLAEEGESSETIEIDLTQLAIGK